MAYKYALPGPPFNFLGHMSETQKAAFTAWVNQRLVNFSAIREFHQIRAQQLRKTAGLLEKFYSSVNDEHLVPTFQKQAWQPGTDGHFGYAYRDDHLPAVAVAGVKAKFKEQLQRHDEAVFFMNHLRNQIERQEDLAQDAADAPQTVKDGLAQLEHYFSQPQYQAVLVRDQSDLYKGEPRFRVNQLDEPTAWEKFLANHGDGPINLKETTPTT